MTFEKVAKIIADYKDIDVAAITPESTFSELGVDSLDTVELIMNFEDELGAHLEMSPVAHRMQELEYSEGFTAEEFERLGVGAMRKAAREGDEQNGSFMCGQIAGLVKKEQLAAEIIREMFDEAEALLKGAAQWVK